MTCCAPYGPALAALSLLSFLTVLDWRRSLTCVRCGCAVRGRSTTDDLEDGVARGDRLEVRQRRVPVGGCGGPGEGDIRTRPRPFVRVAFNDRGPLAPRPFDEPARDGLPAPES